VAECADDAIVERVPPRRPVETGVSDATWVHARNIVFVTNGRFTVTRPDGREVALTAGEGCFPVNQAGATRIAAAAAGAEWLCIVPRELRRRWAGQAHALAGGDALMLPGRSRAYVVSGRLGEAGAHTLVAVGKACALNARGDTRVIVLRRAGTADLHPRKAYAP
jgi:hypothetical protein